MANERVRLMDDNEQTFRPLCRQRGTCSLSRTQARKGNAERQPFLFTKLQKRPRRITASRGLMAREAALGYDDNHQQQHETKLLNQSLNNLFIMN